MSEFPACPACNEEITYPDRENYVCATCGHEWPMDGSAVEEESNQKVVRDAHGNPLADGDTVILIKDLKLKGSSTVLKMGTRVTNIRIVDGDHDLDCRVDGMKIMLKSEFMKKA
ncbi:MAG: zinc ribbon domain-containing protein YjdM [Pseudomonas sp.]|jgi:protein PhnA|nr:zinc ribbon domain-containing protein YjdM [Pseudomonas sp.]MDD2222683.1 zinc ribbon domain-containing protein YjdM [Pseudomonas sp.]MDY0413762.1 zinc ribbon domain-containing protein YjdM [Pseudomonas sp.]NLO53605.1 alkylphosphonate utilization protein [Gammaproteobacteria bacterium]